MEIFRVENLSFAYPDAVENALSDVSFTVNSGEIVLLCGKSASSKTTLLKLLKPQLSPKGKMSGKIFFMNTPLEELSQSDLAQKIGFVMQSPDAQTVCDTALAELSFGLESVGAPSELIRRRVAETVAFFGIDGWLDRRVCELSGGMKQLLGLASVMTMQPDVIIFDEPTAQLDPVSTENFFDILRKINRRFGTTVIISEHNLEECFQLADKVIFLENGRASAIGRPEIAAEKILKTDMKSALPASAVIFEDTADNIPLNVREARQILSEGFCCEVCKINKRKLSEEQAVSLKNVWFRYEKNSKDVLKGISLTVNRGEICTVVGTNGSGKTTLMSVIAKLSKAYRGEVCVFGKKLSEYKSRELYNGCLAYLPQNPKRVFTESSVKADIEESCKALGVSFETAVDICRMFKVEHLLEKHPNDLSGGELQKCALAKVLISKPKILLLDEPTKALDGFYKSALCENLKRLSREGITIITVTHDLAFASEISDKCCLLFDGEITSQGNPQEFFSENYFYTTPSACISRGIIENAVTPEQVKKSLVKKKEPKI